MNNLVSSQERLNTLLNTNQEVADGSSAPFSADSVSETNAGLYPSLEQDESMYKEQEAEEDQIADSDAKYSCGIGTCRPTWLQRFANLKVFAISYGIAGIWLTTFSAFFGTQITSVERHFGISSSKVGLIISSNDIGYLIAVLFGSHFLRNSHIPRWLSLSGIVFGFSMIVSSFGQFFHPRVWEVEKSSLLNSTLNTGSDRYLCTTSEIETGSSESNGTDFSKSSSQLTSSHLPWAFWLLFACTMVGGAFKSYRISILTVYVETNIEDKNQSGMLLGTCFTALLFGPPIAMLLGGALSVIPVDMKPSQLDKGDPRWIGAWWLGFVILGVASVIFCTPISLFPASMKKHKSASLKERDTMSQHSTEQIHDRRFSLESMKAAGKITKSTMKALLEIPKGVLRMLKNPVYALSLLASCVSSFAFSGWFAFSQKYMETQFNKKQQEVSFTLGIVTIFSLAFGTFLGGFICTKLKLKLSGCLVTVLILAITTIAMDMFSVFAGCGNSQVLGVTKQMKNPCSCNDQDILFVCSDNGTNFRSPCHAGCMTSVVGEFRNCSLVNGGSVTPGLCEIGCPYYIPYLVLYFLSALVGCVTIMPSYLVIVRSVEPRDQSLASGTNAFFNTLIGVLPSPIVFGKIVDSTCRFWHPTAGYCVLYHNDELRLYYNGLSMLLRIGNLFVTILCLYIVRRQLYRSPGKSDSTEEIKLRNREKAKLYREELNKEKESSKEEELADLTST